MMGHVTVFFSDSASFIYPNRMQSLLRWSIENSTPQQDGGRQPATQQQKLDTGIIDMILGRSDAEQMKEDVGIASDRNKSEDERLAALDHLEMVSVQRLDGRYVNSRVYSLLSKSIMRMVRDLDHEENFIEGWQIWRS